MARSGVWCDKLESATPGEDSSDSDEEPIPISRFHRKLSTKHSIKSNTAIKEGYLLKQTSFQRWQKRYFKLKGRKLYYAKDAKAVIFDEVEISNISIADIRTRHVTHGFQLITPTRKLQLCAPSGQDMDDWISALKSASAKEEYEGGEAEDLLSGSHQWFASTHARPTYCNVCRDPLFGVTPHGLSCEICKYKVHKRCAVKAINNCKWTTLASVGHEIIEDQYGNIKMPHQWMEGNLPVSAKCAVCEKTCGSVLRLQDWRCLWCRATVHTACRPSLGAQCPLGLAKVSMVPPTALHSIGTDEAWDVIRPTGCSPLLVFVNSRSGDNQGVKFLRRFKQLLNPAQVFDLVHGGPSLGLRLFRHFDPFRILICSGDGSVGWVLSEIDRLNMHKQCQVGVLPLGTGNDLARVLGWGASCDDDTHLPQLLDKYEKASTKMLDRWSLMTLERNVVIPRATSHASLDELQLAAAMTAGETSVLAQLTRLLQADQRSAVVASAKVLCDTIRELTMRVASSSLCQGDEALAEKTRLLNAKLENLVRVLDMEGDEKTDLMSEKQEKEMNNQIEKDKTKEGKALLLSRANSLKKAVKQLAEYTEQVADHTRNAPSCSPPSSLELHTHLTTPKPISSTIDVPTSESQRSSPRPSIHLQLPSPMSSRHPSAGDIRLSALSPLPDVRRESACDDLLTLPAPDAFADALAAHRRSLTVESENRLVVPSLQIEDGPQLDVDAAGSLWENVVSSLNEDTRSLVGSRRGSAQERRDSRVLCLDPFPENPEDFEYLSVSGRNQHRPSVCSLTETAFCTAGGELAHIDSSESPSEEASPPTAAASPPSPLRRSRTEVALGPPVVPAPPRSPSLGFPTKPSELGVDNHSEDNLAFDKEGDKRLMAVDEEFGYVVAEDDLFDTQAQLPRFGGLSRKDSRRLYTDSDIDATADIELEPELRCSLARFGEGSDIARMSFRKKPRRVTTAPASDEDLIQINFKGSNGDLTKEWIDDLTLEETKVVTNRHSGFHSETDEEDDTGRGNGLVPQFTMVVDPPSPVHDDPWRRFSTDSVGKPEPGSHLHASPQATRRVSNCSLLNPELIQAFAEKGRSKSIDKTEDTVKKLPIINPLVRLPTWPNVSPCAGLVSKVLLANADALCATAAPLMDVDETLLEGFNERCVMNNYFGIGIDAKITLDFHIKRENNPEKCRTRVRNFMWYSLMGTKQCYERTYRNLEQRVQLECDGQRIPLPSLQGIVVLNIPSFMGGTNFWGGVKEDDCFLAPSFDDRILEVVAVFGSIQMAASRFINLQHHRIAQCQTVQINILGDEGVPIQVDGEAWIQPPGVIRIIHKNRMQMLCRNRALETSLRSWQEKQRQNLHSTQQTSHEAPGPRDTHQSIGLSEEECRLLLGFIEVTTTLVKCVTLLALAHPMLDKSVYEAAEKTSAALDAIHPGGKLVEGSVLRSTLTKLVHSAKDLYEEACSVLRTKAASLKIGEDMEGKLSSALADMEIELRKCSIEESGQVRLHHIFEQVGGRGRSAGRGLFWLKTRRQHRQREAASWGVQEVSQWLENLQLPEYVESFAKNDIRGRELLALARRDLKDLGVTKVGHIKRILQAIRELSM